MPVTFFRGRSKVMVMSTIASDSPLNILLTDETVSDRDLVPKDHQYEMAYAEPNGHVTSCRCYLLAAIANN